MVCWSEEGLWEPGGTYESVGVGDDHVCAVKTGGDVECWGSDEDRLSTPPPGPFVSVNAGEKTSCGIRSDGSMTCWGTLVRWGSLHIATGANATLVTRTA